MNRRLILLLSYIITLLLMTLLGYMGDLSNESYDTAMKYFSSSEIETGKNFFRFSLLPWTLYRIMIITVFFYLIYSSRYKTLINWIKGKVKNSFLRLLTSTALLYIFLNLLKLPFHIIAGYVRDRSFQVTEIDFMTWLIRHGVSVLISIALVSLSLSLILFLINRTKRYILYVPLMFAAIALVFSVVYPRVVMPLFYDTGEVDDPALKSKIMDLVERAGIEEVDLHVIYKSRYRITANAFFTGTGPRREIYLYDTLLKKFDHDEILTILAHELVHYNEEHVLIGVLLGAAGLFIFMPFLNFTAEKLFHRDIKWLTLPEGLPALLFILTIMLYFIKPVENSLSRIMERRADINSFELIENRDVFIEMEKKMAVINRSNILPNPLFAFFYYTHPPVLDRIKSAEQYRGNKDN
jgi:STE24 endopeptidase